MVLILPGHEELALEKSERLVVDFKIRFRIQHSRKHQKFIEEFGKFFLIVWIRDVDCALALARNNFCLYVLFGTGFIIVPDFRCVFEFKAVLEPNEVWIVFQELYIAAPFVLHKLLLKYVLAHVLSHVIKSEVYILMVVYKNIDVVVQLQGNYLLAFVHIEKWVFICIGFKRGHQRAALFDVVLQENCENH